VGNIEVRIKRRKPKLKN